MSNPEAEVREYPSVLAVARGYGLEVTNYLATPGGYLLEATDGKYWLKPFAGSEKELSYVVAASEHLRRRGFPYLCRCLRLQDGAPGIRFRRVLFHLVEAPPGPSPELRSHEELRAAGARLAWLHLAARAFEPPPALLAVRSEWGSCERVFKERLLDLYDFQETAVDRPRQTRFDALYLEHFNDFVDAAREAVDIVAELPLARMIAASRAERQLCHGDFTPAALAVDQQGELVVADLEMVRFDLRALDVAELIRATAECDSERAEAVLTGYHAAFPLSMDDFLLVEAYLRFPQEYWRAANAYYREGINSRARLVETVANYAAVRRFLDAFHRLGDRFPPEAVDPTEATAAPLSAPEAPVPPAIAEPFPVEAPTLTSEPSPNMGEPSPNASEPSPNAGEPSQPEAPPTARRRTLEEICLFDEPLPARRRAEAPEPAQAAPAAVEQPSVGAARQDAAPSDLKTSATPPDGNPVAATACEAAAPPADAPDAEGVPVQVPDAGAAVTPGDATGKKKIVWKFPAPLPKPILPKQEDTR